MGVTCSTNNLHATKIQVGAGDNFYDVVIGSQLIGDAGSIICDKLPLRRCAIVSDTNIGPLFGTRLEQGLSKAGIQSIPITIPAGEQAKTLSQVGEICDRMLAGALDRHSFVIGMGGGVIGDIAGFAAAIFQRGIPHVHIPTTLLAMVDSSIGGKSGVNTAAGKNLIGAVHQPALVLDDVDVLAELPEREFNQGFAEIIKHGVIADRQMFEELRAMRVTDFRVKEGRIETLAPLIGRNIQIKSRIVKKDELDRTGDRALLNFGHTVGHGIEVAGGYKKFLHGQAISLGMVAAAEVSMKRAGLPGNQRDEIVDILNRFDLPTRLPKDFPREQILDALKFDKKFERGEVRFVVTPQIGSAYLSVDVTMNDIRDAVDAI